MQAQTLFYILIGIIVIKFLIDTVINAMNAKHFNDSVPQELDDLFDKDEYLKSQNYKRINYRFSLITSSFSVVVLLLFFAFDGFAFVDNLVRSFTSGPIKITLIFFGIIYIANELVSIPFSYYGTFVIEEKFGFNRSTLKTFVFDKIKGWFLMLLIGGSLLAFIAWIYGITKEHFWLYAWGVLGVFSIFMNMFYAKLIVPLFNKQTALDDGSLKNAIEKYARKIGFKIDNIFVIDGSKRSTKANAYFSGFGAQKRITLYDTLIKDMEEPEIVAVLAHEVGHYKKRHVIYNLILSLLITGFTLYIFSLLAGNQLLSEALNVSESSLHIGLIAFAILYAPISEITGFFMNSISRKFEYQADNYAKTTFSGQHLISALKKLSKKNLSNLTPHWLYVKIHYSHPPLAARIKNLKK